MATTAIHVTHWGSEGPLALMVHGSAQGSEAGGPDHFRRQQELVSKGWRIVLPDRPGHGRSPSPGRPDDAEADGVWLADLMDGGAHLVGHSYGGCVCLAAAARRPEAVRSLTVIEPAMMAVAVDDPRVQSLLGQLAALYVEEDNAALADGFARVLRIPEAIHGGRTAANRKAMGAGLRALKIPAADELRANLAVVRAANIPLLVITGGWSGWFEAVGERVAELGGGRWVVTPSQDHFPQLNSGEFNGLLDRFMRSAESAAADPARTA